MTFAVTLPVRFADCDPAGIAYFPRLLALVDAAIEDWTAAALGIDRRTLHLDRRLALPTVHLDTQFRAPARLGDSLSLAVTVEAIGHSSIRLGVRAGVAGTLCLEAGLVQVLTDADSMQSRPWPADWRARLERHLPEIVS